MNARLRTARPPGRPHARRARARRAEGRAVTKPREDRGAVRALRQGPGRPQALRRRGAGPLPARRRLGQGHRRPAQGVRRALPHPLREDRLPQGPRELQEPRLHHLRRARGDGRRGEGGLHHPHQPPAEEAGAQAEVRPGQGQGRLEGGRRGGARRLHAHRHPRRPGAARSSRRAAGTRCSRPCARRTTSWRR